MYGSIWKRRPRISKPPPTSEIYLVSQKIQHDCKSSHWPINHPHDPRLSQSGTSPPALPCITGSTRKFIKSPPSPCFRKTRIWDDIAPFNPETFLGVRTTGSRADITGPPTNNPGQNTFAAKLALEVKWLNPNCTIPRIQTFAGSNVDSTTGQRSANDTLLFRATVHYRINQKIHQITSLPAWLLKSQGFFILTLTIPGEDWWIIALGSGKMWRLHEMIVWGAAPWSASSRRFIIAA